MKRSERIWHETGLVEAALRGEEDAWAILYAEAFDPLYQYVAWRCGGRQDETEEVVQETWLIAVRRIGSFSPARGAFQDWLRGIAANVLRNRNRRRRRRLAARPLADAPCPSEAGCAESAAAADRAQQVADALSALPPHYEMVLRAKYVDGLSVAEIADRLKQTPKAAESLLARAREAFRKAYRRREQSDEWA